MMVRRAHAAPIGGQSLIMPTQQPEGLIMNYAL